MDAAAHAPTLDAAIDDYLHLIVRTRPWTKAREEELLDAFCDWAYARPGPAPTLAAASPALAARHAADAGYTPGTAAELAAALGRLAAWAVARGLMAENPFGGREECESA